MVSPESNCISVTGASEHNLKGFDLSIPRGQITVITGVSGSGKSSLAFDTILAESNRRFFYTLSHYTRQFLDLGSRPSVGKIQGLSPAISLSQNETQPSKRATVGTLTDAGEVIGVLMAKFAEAYCPEHGEPTSGIDKEQVLNSILSRYEGKTIALCAPFVDQKKGAFERPLKKFASKFSYAYIDGSIVSLSEPPKLSKDQKHDIKIVVDYVTVNAKKKSRLEASLDTMFEIGEGRGEFFVADGDGNIASDLSKISLRHGCPTCGFSWPKLDSRYFSSNSLGRCEKCDGLGYIEDESNFPEKCSYCQGTGLKRELGSIRFKGKSPHAFHLDSVDKLLDFLQDCLSQINKSDLALNRVIEELRNNLERLSKVGLGYLSLSRRIRSLSGGEAQRVRLAGVLAENLRGVLYVLDEPSQGLSDKELDMLWRNIEGLKSQGNTVIIVDHDETIIKRSDLVIDLGPEGGARGGHIVAKFKPENARQFVHESMTAKYLLGTESHTYDKSSEPMEGWIELKEPSLNNLDIRSVKFPLNRFSVVSGVSGAGKSSLVLGVLYENLMRYINDLPSNFHCQGVEGLDKITEVLLVDRKPIAKSSVSTPATYLDAFTDLRNFYGKLPEAQIQGLTARDFSTSVEGGRCSECKGRGELSLSMKFLADSRTVCPVCQGKRYKPEILQVEYRGLNLSDILDLTIDQVLEHFSTFRRICKKLQPAVDLGLGYLKLGQPSSSLSGGESQRLKLAPLLSRNVSEGTVILMDEPTTGLHFRDVDLLLDQCRKLVEKGATLVVIEHSSAVLSSADWWVELGPGAASQGGKLVKCEEISI